MHSRPVRFACPADPGTSTSTSADDDDDDETSTSSSTTSSSSSTDTDDLLTSSSSTSSTSSSSSSSRTRSSSSNTRSLTSSTSAFLSDTSLPSTALPSDTSSPAPTGDSGSSSHTGAIAGGVVGGVVGLIVVATIVALLFMGARKKRRNQMAPEMAQQTHYDYPPSSMYASPSNPSPSPFGSAAANYHEPSAMHSVVPDVAPPVAAAGLAGTGAGAAAVTRRSGATRQRSGASRMPPERGLSSDHMAAAADEAIGVSASSPVRSTHSPTYESPMSSPPRRRVSQETRPDVRPDVYQQADPNMWPSSYMDGWIAGENPYAAAGVSHLTDDPPPPTAFHMRPANASAGGSALSPVGAFIHQPTFADTHGSTNAAQRQSRA